MFYSWKGTRSVYAQKEVDDYRCEHRGGIEMQRFVS